MSTKNVSSRKSIFTRLCPELQGTEDDESFVEVLVTRPAEEPDTITKFRNTVQGLINGLDESKNPDLHETIVERSERVINLLARFSNLPMKESRLSAIWSAAQATPPTRVQAVFLDVLPDEEPHVVVHADDDLLEGEQVFDFQGVGHLEVWTWELDVDPHAYREATVAVAHNMFGEVLLPGTPYYPSKPEEAA